MAQFNGKDFENYATPSTNSSFFSLKNDKDVARVRFLYNTIEDVTGYAVHEIEVDGKKRYVNCLREYNEPIDNCPLCRARYKLLTKLFVMMYDEDSKEVKIWDRGRTFYSKLASLCSRYKPLVSTPFEIERRGKKGDQGTTYETYPLQSDNTKLEDMPEIPELLGTLIMDKSYEELQYFLDNGEFTDQPKAQRQQQEEPIRRRTPTAYSSHSTTAVDKF